MNFGPSSDTRQAAQKALATLQSELSNGSLLASKRSLYRPSCWPFSPSLSALSSDSKIAALARDFSLLEGYAYDLSASTAEDVDVRQSELKHLTAHPVLALALPWQRTQLLLTGTRSGKIESRQGFCCLPACCINANLLLLDVLF